MPQCFVWKEDYSIGNAELNAQHACFLQLMGIVCNADSDDHRIADALEEVRQYVSLRIKGCIAKGGF